MAVTLTKWGNSVGVRISQSLLQRVGLRVGDQVEADYQDGVGIVLRPAIALERTRVDVSSMIANITPNTLPDVSEFETQPMGGEVW